MVGSGHRQSHLSSRSQIRTGRWKGPTGSGHLTTSKNAYKNVVAEQDALLDLNTFIYILFNIYIYIETYSNLPSGNADFSYPERFADLPLINVCHLSNRWLTAVFLSPNGEEGETFFTLQCCDL